MTRTHEDYTVGWICALPLELAAAREMLDEEHENLPAERNDRNAYSLGRIGTHNVVLACLPAGELGVASAAVTVTHMVSTFPCVKICLVVGVGGGVPDEDNDIRLGDVVVGDGGVIQYDMGKTVQGGRFICTQDRLRPSRILLSTVSNLRAIHLLHAQRMEEYIDTMTSRHPDFSRPGVESDVLYTTSYEHPEEAVSCAQCDPTQCVSRVSRPSTHPVVHYGLIASGNQVMRHGATRDDLRKQHDILCFEMEAAGLMREFPSLVIRGICDYADSHKNKTWQHYAAVTAAAYAKELLTIVPDPLLSLSDPCFMAPSVVAPKFVGRKDILALIDNKVEARELVVLAGIGGVGYGPWNLTPSLTDDVI
jgi:nucleoside phosphorylase